MNDISVILIFLITFPFVLFLLRIMIISWRYFILSRQMKNFDEQQAVRRQRAESPYGSTNNCNNPNTDSSCHMGPKEFDFPPAYDEVMQSYLMAKQQTLENDTNAGANNTAAATSSTSVNLSTAISTLTIETDIASSNHASTIDLSNPSTTATTNVAINQPPPSYEHSIEISNAKLNNDHVV